MFHCPGAFPDPAGVLRSPCGPGDRALQECNPSTGSSLDCGCIPPAPAQAWAGVFSAADASASQGQSEKLIFFLSAVRPPFSSGLPTNSATDPKKRIKPTRCDFNTLRQVCNYIPAYLVPRLARECEIDARGFSPWSHVVSLLSAQMAHSIGLNDVCDSLNLHSGPLSTIRGATPPSRNGLSNANRERSPEMAEKLFWAMRQHLGEQSPGFIRGKGRGAAYRFKAPISIMDSTVIQLVANNLDWAKHRRRKAAAKTHLRLSLQSLLPPCVIIDTAKEHDNQRARELCAGLQEGEIAIFDKAYIDYGHLLDLGNRGVSWVTRAKDNMAYEVYTELPVEKGSKILSDEVVVLKDSNKAAPEYVRLVRALVEVDGEEREMTFMTNNLKWSAQSVVDLYQCRWEIEVFFKQVKQTLQIADFLGNNENAVKWQIWMALLLYVLLRYLSYLSNWSHSFTRLFTVLRAAMWEKFDLLKLLKCYGTAGGSFRNLARPEQAYFAGF